MKRMLWAGAAVVLFAGSADAQEVIMKPIDTQKLVVQPTQTAAGIAARTIDLVGQTSANSIDNNNWVRLTNFLMGRRVSIPTVQAGRSSLPAPHLFPSTGYKNYNTPVMPTMQQRRR
ncbi:MAG TPA: hypothetical protein VM529_15820 [Gemmata sp.]|nr:hypothetical protein [Gemmata sp.]